MMADGVRVLITGNGGSGKTWLGQRLAERLSVPLVRLDDLYWDGAYGGRERDKRVVFDEVATRAAEPSWVIEGVYGWLLPAALPRATEFIFLDLPVDACLDNVRRRGNQGSGDEAAFAALLAWVAEYPNRENSNSRLTHRRLWDGFAGSREILRRRDELDAYLNRRTSDRPAGG
jgi:adenylate kinase family enzyme